MLEESAPAAPASGSEAVIEEGEASNVQGPYLAAIDQGTTSTRFIVYDTAAKVVASHQLEFTQIYPQAGWVEHDPMEILDTVRKAMDGAIAKGKEAGLDVPGKLKGIGITNQRDNSHLEQEHGKALLQCSRLDGQPHEFHLQAVGEATS